MLAVLLVAFSVWFGSERRREAPVWLVSLLAILMAAYVLLSLAGLGLVRAFRLSPTLGFLVAVLHSLSVLYPFVAAYLAEASVRLMLPWMQQAVEHDQETKVWLRVVSESPQLLAASALSAAAAGAATLAGSGDPPTLQAAAGVAVLLWARPLLALLALALLLLLAARLRAEYRLVARFALARGGVRARVAPVLAAALLALGVAGLVGLAGFYSLVRASLESLSEALLVSGGASSGGV